MGRHGEIVMYQIVNRRKPKEITYIRKLPETVKNPTKYQTLQRITFGEISKSLKSLGKLHPIERATLIGELMKGKRFGRTRKKKKWEIEIEKELGIPIEEIEILLKR